MRPDTEVDALHAPQQSPPIGAPDQIAKAWSSSPTFPPSETVGSFSPELVEVLHGQGGLRFEIEGVLVTVSGRDK